MVISVMMIVLLTKTCSYLHHKHHSVKLLTGHRPEDDHDDGDHQDCDCVLDQIFIISINRIMLVLVDCDTN